MSKPRKYKLSPAALAQRRAASKIAGEKRRKGPRKSVSLRADAADILRDAAKNRGLSKSEVIRRDVKPEAASLLNLAALCQRCHAPPPSAILLAVGGIFFAQVLPNVYGGF